MKENTYENISIEFTILYSRWSSVVSWEIILITLGPHLRHYCSSEMDRHQSCQVSNHDYKWNELGGRIACIIPL